MNQLPLEGNNTEFNIRLIKTKESLDALINVYDLLSKIDENTTFPINFNGEILPESFVLNLTYIYENLTANLLKELEEMYENRFPMAIYNIDNPFHRARILIQLFTNIDSSIQWASNSCESFSLSNTQIEFIRQLCKRNI